MSALTTKKITKIVYSFGVKSLVTHDQPLIIPKKVL